MNRQRSLTLLKWTAIFLVPVLVLCVIGVPAARAGAPHLPTSWMLAGFALETAVLPTFDKLDDIPEAFRPAYEEKAGKFVPKVEDASGLKSKNAELLTKLTKAQERAKLIGDRSAEDIQADLELAAKTREQKAKDEGNFETLKADMAKRHSAELEKERGERTAVEGKLFDVLGKREAEKEIVALGIKPKVLLPHVLPHIKVVKVDGEYQAIVVDGKGNPRIADGQATPMSIKDLVAEIAADPEFDGVVPASGSAGSGARNETGNRGAGATIVISKEDARDTQKYRAAKARAEKAGVPFRVAD